MTLNRSDLELAGVRVTGTDTRLAGATDTVDRDLAFGERVVLITEAIVTNVGLKSTTDGARIVRNLKAIDVFELAGDDGARVINALRATRSAHKAEEAGELPLPGLDVHATGDGVVLTNRDLDALAGNPIDDLTGDELARYAESEPWPNYSDEPVGGVADYLDLCREDLTTEQYRDKLLHVLAYEEGHKGRRGVLDYALGELTDVGPDAPLPDPTAGDGLDGEVDLGDDEDSLDVPPPPDVEGIDAVGTERVIEELEADRDAEVEIDGTEDEADE